MPLSPDDWITPSQAEQHLNKSTPLQGDDLEELIGFIQRAEQAVIDRIGYVKQPATAIVEYHPGGSRLLRLDKRPVFEISEISVAGAVVDEADLDADAPSGWYIKHNRAGLVAHTDVTFPSGFTRVTYKPGWPVIPESITQATLELLRHLWKTQRGRVDGRRAGTRGQDPIDPTQPLGTGFQWPNRVTQALHPYEQVPVA